MNSARAGPAGATPLRSPGPAGRQAKNSDEIHAESPPGWLCTLPQVCNNGAMTRTHTANAAERREAAIIKHQATEAERLLREAAAFDTRGMHGAAKRFRARAKFLAAGALANHLAAEHRAAPRPPKPLTPAEVERNLQALHGPRFEL